MHEYQRDIIVLLQRQEISNHIIDKLINMLLHYNREQYVIFSDSTRDIALDFV